MAFGSVGMYFTGIIKHIDLFNLPFFLFITPMFLFSGTFFPVENLPQWAQVIAGVLPLTHLVNLSRSLCYGGIVDGKMFWQVGYILAFWMVFFALALRKMRQRLIR
jgi:lipooligosaccharide transport system permease protein